MKRRFWFDWFEIICAGVLIVAIAVSGLMAVRSVAGYRAARPETEAETVVTETETVTETAAPETEAETESAGTPMVTTEDVNVRSGPGTDHDVLGSLSSGTEVTAVGEDGDWVIIEYGDGTGYIYGDYVEEK